MAWGFDLPHPQNRVGGGGGGGGERRCTCGIKWYGPKTSSFINIT